MKICTHFVGYKLELEFSSEIEDFQKTNDFFLKKVEIGQDLISDFVKSLNLKKTFCKKLRLM